MLKETLCPPRMPADADVRAFTVEALRVLGYDVLESRDGNSALNVLSQTPAGKIDLDGQDSSRHVN